MKAIEFVDPVVIPLDEYANINLQCQADDCNHTEFRCSECATPWDFHLTVDHRTWSVPRLILNAIRKYQLAYTDIDKVDEQKVPRLNVDNLLTLAMVKRKVIDTVDGGMGGVILDNDEYKMVLEMVRGVVLGPMETNYSLDLYVSIFKPTDGARGPWETSPEEIK